MKKLLASLVVLFGFIFSTTSLANSWGDLQKQPSAWDKLAVSQSRGVDVTPNGLQEQKSGSMQKSGGAQTMGSTACYDSGDGQTYCPCSNPVQYCWMETTNEICGWITDACAATEIVCVSWILVKEPTGTVVKVCAATTAVCKAVTTWVCKPPQQVKRCSSKCP